MKTSLKLLVVLCIAAIAGNANAQGSSAYTTATVNATVIAPITIGNVHDMALGKIVADPTGGSMSIASDGSRTFSNAANQTPSNPVGTPAEFSSTGDPGALFTVLHTGVGTGSGVNDLFLSDGASHTMWFVLDGTAAQTLTAGADDYKVTGTLTIGASQAAGVYQGSFVELVAYE